MFCSHSSSLFHCFPFPKYFVPPSDGMAPRSSALLSPQTITLSPDIIAQTTRILHWFSQRDEQGHLSNLISYQSGDRNGAAKRLLLDTAMLLNSEPSQTVEDIKQRVDDMVELYLHWRATAESVGWGTDPANHDFKVDDVDDSLTIRETILSFCYYYYDMDAIMHGDPKIERSATSETRPNLVMEKHPSIGVNNLVSIRPRRLRSSTRTVTAQKIIKAGRHSSGEPSDFKEVGHGTEDELTRGKRPDGMSVRKYWSLPSSSSGPESQAHASQTSPEKSSLGQRSFQQITGEEFHDLVLSAPPAILPIAARKHLGEPSKNHQSGPDEQPDMPEDIPLDKPLHKSLDKIQNKPHNERRDKRRDRSQDEPLDKAQEEEPRKPHLSPHQEVPKDSKPASSSNELLLWHSSTNAKVPTPKIELRPTLPKSKTKSKSPSSASPSNEPLFLRSNTVAKTQTHKMEHRPIAPKPKSPDSVSLTGKDQSTDVTDHRPHLAFAHAVRANPSGTLHIPSFYAPMNPPGISLDFYPDTTPSGPAQTFGDAHMPPQSASHQNGVVHTRPTLQLPDYHTYENLSSSLSTSSRDFLDQRALFPPAAEHFNGKSGPLDAAEEDSMAAPGQARNHPLIRQPPMIFPPPRSIFQTPRGPSVLISPNPISSRVASNSTLMKRGRERAHSAANSNSDTPPLQKKRSRIGSPPKPTLDDKLVEAPMLRRERSADAQQYIAGIHTTLEDRQNEERRKSKYETQMLIETGNRLAKESNQAAENLRKANARLHQHLVVITTKAYEKVDAQADLFSTGDPQREHGSAEMMGMLHNNVGGVYHHEELIRRQDEMLRRMEEAIGRQDEKIDKMVKKWGKKK